MKKSKVILMLAMLWLSTAKGQIDISCDASSVGIYPTLKVSYPFYDKLVIGASYGYNVFDYLISDRIDLTVGLKFNEWVQLEADFGIITGYESQPDKILGENKSFIPHLDLGLKAHFWNNCFMSLQVAYPGFIKFGLGVRLRPYKKLTVWDKQY